MSLVRNPIRTHQPVPKIEIEAVVPFALTVMQIMRAYIISILEEDVVAHVFWDKLKTTMPAGIHNNIVQCGSKLNVICYQAPTEL